ncbi:MAG: hypothetical protein R3D88_07505 [Alphaproteobacteria bacterium]
MKIKSYSLILIFATFMSIAAVAAENSVIIDLEKIKPLTPIEFLPQAEFEQKTKLFEDTPYDDKFLSFQIRLPSDWEETTLPNSVVFSEKGGLNQNVLGIVARYVGPPINHQRSSFSVEAVELTHEIGARDWFIYYVMKSGLSIEQVGLESEKQVEAIYVEIVNDITYLVRVKVIVNGPRMIVARYFLPQDNYKEERELQAQIIDSFQLTNRQEIPIEPLEIYGFLDQSFFDYPASWALSSPNIRSIERMRAMVYHGTAQTELAGQINIYLSNKILGTTKSEELTYYKDKFVIDGYHIGNFIEDINLEYHKDMTFGRTQAYEMKSNTTELIDYELWVSVLENDQYIYAVTLLTPGRNEDFYTWARNKSAYSMVIKGIRLKDENVDYYRFLK